MFHRKSLAFSLFAAVLVVVMACTSTVQTPTAPPPTATPVPPTATPTPEPTSTPVPIALITIDPIRDPAGFLKALPATEASCLSDALGSRDRVLAILESALESDPISSTEARAIDECVSDETVQSVFVGQIERETGGLSDATVICIGEQIGGLSAAALFVDEPQVDAAISLLKGIFCLNHEERAVISTSTAAYGFGDFGGIDGLECVVNGVGPTGLADLMGALSSGTSDNIDFSALSDLFTVLVECSVLDDSAFEESGITADQVACLLDALGDSGLAFSPVVQVPAPTSILYPSTVTSLDPDAPDPELGDLGAMFSALEECGIALDDLLDGSALPLDPNDSGDAGTVSAPTVQIDPTADTQVAPVAGDIDLPFTEEQIACLTDELGEEMIFNLLAGAAPDLTLFAALESCDIDIMSLLAP
jgi:hypothetical protein